MKVSICMITYNQEQYIEQALGSALMQETDFDYEIVIGEDCSTDRTRAVLTAIQRQHPERIRLLLREHNLGIQFNFVQTLAACRGQYIACLEGDDFWTSPHKLQKQVDFLEAHPECAICFHRAQILYDQEPDQQAFVPAGQFAEISPIEVLFGHTNPIATCSVMFRNRLFTEFPDWYFGLQLGDWPLHILNARFGRIGYLPELLSAYRVHAGGKWSALPPYRTIPYVVEMLTHVNQYFKFEYNAPIEQTITEMINYLSWDLIKNHSAEARAQVIRQIAGTTNSDVVAQMAIAAIAKAAELERAKERLEEAQVWLEQQYANWQAEAERRGLLIQQHESKLTALAELQRSTEEQRNYWKAQTDKRDAYLREITARSAFRALAKLGALPQPFVPEAEGS